MRLARCEGAFSICAGARRVLKEAVRCSRSAADFFQFAEPDATVTPRVAVAGSAFAAGTLARWPLGATCGLSGGGEGERKASDYDVRHRFHARGSELLNECLSWSKSNGSELR